MSAPAARDGTAVVVYDLDGVITRRDSFTAVVVDRLRRAPLRLLKALPAVVPMVLSMRADRRQRAARRVAQIALGGLHEPGYITLATAFGRRIGASPSWVRDEAVQRIRRQHAEGARIVIATATERRLAEALLAAAGIPYDLLSASALIETPSGMKFADHRVGMRKAEALREQGVPIEAAEFVTDSLADLPTARAAGRVVLIGASPRTRRRYARAAVSLAVPVM